MVGAVSHVLVKAHVMLAVQLPNLAEADDGLVSSIVLLEQRKLVDYLCGEVEAGVDEQLRLYYANHGPLLA